MGKDTHQKTVHVNANDILPAVASASFEAEMLKKILEQMVENERKRIRNEFMRIGLFALVVFLLILGGVFWLSAGIFQELHQEKEYSARAWNKLMQSLPGQDRIESRMKSSSANFKKGHTSQQPVKREETQKSLMSKLLTWIKSSQRQVYSQEPTRPAAPSGKQTGSIHDRGSGKISSTESAKGQADKKKKYAKSLTMQVKGDIPLRVPIPTP